MITCDFFGGLGNNLFQLATVYAIHKRCGVELEIPSKASRGDIQQYNQEPTLELDRLFDNKFVYNDSLVLTKYVHPDTDLQKTDYSYVEVPLYDNACYHGYFQSDRYFLDVDISKEFILKQSNVQHLKNKYKDLFAKKNIALHYRLGGDRVTPHMQYYHKNVSVEYYKKALELVTDYNEKDYNILVFSDRIGDCKELLKPLNYPFLFIENENNVLDFTMMSLCDVNIVSNSTFSWWAAYMNQKAGKKIIVPESEWFGPGYSHYNLKDTFPQSWIRL